MAYLYRVQCKHARTISCARGTLVLKSASALPDGTNLHTYISQVCLLRGGGGGEEGGRRRRGASPGEWQARPRALQVDQTTISTGSGRSAIRNACR